MIEVRTVLAAVAPLALAALVIAAAGLQAAPVGESRLRVTASFYPLAYLAEQIGGDRVAVSTLIKPGLEVHTWEPTTQDILSAADADVILYNGADLDPWMQEKILPAVGAKLAAETTSGLALRLAKPGEGDAPGEEGGYDPHTWISPAMALGQAENVYKALAEADPEGSEYYAGRWNILKTKLRSLDAEYSGDLAGKKRGVIYVTHSTFGYLADGYGFEQRSIVGLQADQQPSTETMIRLIDQMAASGTRVFYAEPGYSDVYVLVVQEELQLRMGGKVEILKLYHMNGPADGLDYLQQMETNLENLRKGLEA